MEGRRSLRSTTLRQSKPIEETTAVKRNVEEENEYTDTDTDTDTDTGKKYSQKMSNIISLDCPECSKVLNKTNFNQHMHQVHQKLRFSCNAQNCIVQFDDRKLYHLHQKIHKTRKKWPCSEMTCKYETSNLSDLNSHWNRYHKKGLFQCTLCTATFPYRNQVYNHFYLEHLPSKDYTYSPVKCDFKDCDYIARDKCVLKRHQFTHTGLKPFECTWDGCDFFCNRKAHTIRHIYAKHFGIPQSVTAKERKKMCSRDPNQFVRVLNLN